MNIINQLSNIILAAEDIINFIRVQDFFHGQSQLNHFTKSISTLPAEILSDITDILHCILEAQQHNDNILIADILEARLLPYMNELLQQLIIDNPDLICINHLDDNLSLLNDSVLAQKIRLNAEHALSTDNYVIESSNIGKYILKYNGKYGSFYYHSNVNPIIEASKFASYYADSTCFNYTVLGFGFGYHIAALLDKDQRFQVTVLENNLDILTLAFIYCDLSGILSNSRLHIIYFDLNDTAKYIKADTSDENSLLVIHYPSMMALPDGQIKDLLNNFFINYSSMLSQKKYLDANFYYNMKLKDEPVDTLKNTFFQKSAIYTAAGPSLEYCLDLLKNKSFTKDRILLCASTVYKKLLDNGIIPDFVIMIDAQDNMIKHIENTLPNTSSMIYLSTACTAAVKAFMNKRYIAFQNGYAEAEAFASAHNLSLINTGGSVSTSAIDLLLNFGCSEIITIGLDLAYTDNKRHSFDAKALTGTHNLIPVLSVDGKTIYTTNVLNIYRKWIENRIKSNTTAKLVNLSHGAYINGMENRTSLS